MKLNIAVLAKQVPDTRNVGHDAMNPDGTVNRAALPAVFNPEDLNALEQALRLKDQWPESRITVITMGPERAKDIIRQSLERGADAGYLLTDRLFAGADTLATSYALSMAVRNAGQFDIILCGRQAIDGDTAQTGPQVAEKLGWPQITCAEEILSLTEDSITVRRAIDGGKETVQSTLPVLITVSGTAPKCRPCNARRVLSCRNTEIPSWSVADVKADAQKCGLAGSPTKVKAVESISFQAKESKRYADTDADIMALMSELSENHIIG